MAQPFTVLIMAAGKGTRMRSELPKVLHPLCGVPMVQWVIDAAREAGADRIVCVTRPGDGVAEGLPDGVEVAEQTEGEGTGAAVLAARAAIEGPRPVVVLSGDHPLVSAELVRGLVDAHAATGAAATVLTTEQLDPAGYGRVVRAGDGSIEGIVETKHPERLGAEELAIREVNVGSYAFETDSLVSALEQVEIAGGERPLTGVVPVMRGRGERISAYATDDVSSALGINDRAALMDAESLAARRILERHARGGVTFQAPETTYVERSVRLEADAVVGPGCTLRGATRVGRGARIGPHSTLIDSTVGDGAAILHSYLVEALVRDGAVVGPFAYLRPGAVIGENAKIGTFVEVKNSDVGPGAKVPHLSYLGDADVGEEANVAAGNITANYDGRRKHRTKIGKRAKTGVDTSFVAPVTVGERAYTGAGSVIREDVPDGALGISRPEQENVEGYADRVEKEE